MNTSICRTSYSTISSYQKILPEIVDNRAGKPNFSFYFKNMSGQSSGEAWTASLDDRSAKETAHFNINGSVDQAFAYHFGAAQRPALHDRIFSIKENSI